MIDVKIRGEAASSSANHDQMANALRFLAVDAVEKAKSGHPGMPMGMADVATVLYQHFLKFDVTDPVWPNRDRFVLSAGHGSMLLYGLSYLAGYQKMTLEHLQNFRQLGFKTHGHPELDPEIGIETTTGPLGQGFANAVGMAIAEEKLRATYGADLVDHYTYAIAGDGCLMEGVTQEALSLAGHLRLGKLVVFFDDNQISIDGPTSLAISENIPARFEAAGWHVQSIDGHDSVAIYRAIQEARVDGRPSLIACRTTIGFGAPHKAGTAATHGAPLGAEEIQATRKKLSWDYPPFHIPEDILKTWRSWGVRHQKERFDWEARLRARPASEQDTFARLQDGKLSTELTTVVKSLCNRIAEEDDEKATRAWSQLALEEYTSHFPELMGGSADLTGSNLTKTAVLSPFTKDNPAGRYLHYGVREHAMAAIMNGISVHKGIIPYGGTFLVFSDYCRPSIRLSALMKQGVIYVMTHDSIGLGEDGPTHQPIEHLASLRAIPDLRVLRPADGVETAEAWAIALAERYQPTVLVLSRQKVPCLRQDRIDTNETARGGYRLCGTGDEPVLLIGTGTELSLAVEARKELAAQGVDAAVISMPSWELFLEQPQAYQASILPRDRLRFAIEAGCSMGWEQFISDADCFVGMTSFGASAPASTLYAHFGITAQALVAKVLSKLNINHK